MLHVFAVSVMTVFFLKFLFADSVMGSHELIGRSHGDTDNLEDHCCLVNYFWRTCCIQCNDMDTLGGALSRKVIAFDFGG